MDIVRGGRFTATCVAPRLKTKHVGMTFGVATEFPDKGSILGAQNPPRFGSMDLIHDPATKPPRQRQHVIPQAASLIGGLLNRREYGLSI
jgi:hypothetical protein